MGESQIHLLRVGIFRTGVRQNVVIYYEPEPVIEEVFIAKPKSNNRYMGLTHHLLFKFLQVACA